MQFGPVDTDKAAGCILAHSLSLKDEKLRKGVVLSEGHLEKLRRDGIKSVVVARLNASDIAEDVAAEKLAAAICLATRADMKRSDAFNGRVNLSAAHAGVFRVDATLIGQLNKIDPGITLACLNQNTWVTAGQLLATIKIIPYAVREQALLRALEILNGKAMSVLPVCLDEAALILTRTGGYPEKLLHKGEEAVRKRLQALGVTLKNVETVGHSGAEVAQALSRCDAPLMLILGASATSDINDEIPAGLVLAGGNVTRFGMPVDPGNLLFFGRLGDQQVIGLPGCARSLALNGADWVLERLVCGLSLSDGDIADMGVGGLLKEIPARKQPRSHTKQRQRPARIDVVILAAGASRRMRGADKLTEEIDGVPQLRRAVLAAQESRADRVHVVLPPESEARLAVLEGLSVSTITSQNAAEGMAHSLRAGLEAATASDAIIVVLADMPDITARHLDALIDAFDPEASAEICRSVTGSGQAGHPVLFGRRFYENLADLEGDQGARSILATSEEYIVDVVHSDEAAALDLDTPEQWQAYRANRDV